MSRLIHPIKFHAVFAGIAASAFFASLAAYVQLFKHHNGDIVFAQRVLWMMLILFALLLLRGRLRSTLDSLRDPQKRPIIIACSIVCGFNLWLFVWAPMNGHILDVALGFFLLPLLLVLVGRVFHGERMSRLQSVAVTLATIGVLNILYQNNAMSWVTLLILGGQSLYLLLRRRVDISVSSGLFLENLLILPVALLILFNQGFAHPFDASAHDLGLFAGLGVLSIIPMLLFLYANQNLPVGIFGMISYTEPVLIFSVGLLLGESLSEYFSYGFFTVALLIMSADMYRQHKKTQRLQEGV